jgi:hypothetical protein
VMIPLAMFGAGSAEGSRAAWIAQVEYEPACLRACRALIQVSGRPCWPRDLFDPRRAFTGPATIAGPPGPDDIPVFARAGALLALLPEDTGSLSPYAPALGSRRSMLAFPAASGTSWAGALGPGLSGRSSWGESSWTLKLSGPGDASYEVTAWLPAEPAAVETDGSWSYGDGALTCAASGPSAVLRARWPDGR